MNQPQHVAIIMDGNGRWASGRGMPRYHGHRVGAESAREIVRTAGELKLKALTLYTLSGDNFKRSKRELGFIFALLDHYLLRERQELQKNGVCLRVIGSIERLPPKTQSMLQETEAYLQAGKGMVLSIALDYHGRSEISAACQRVAELVATGAMQANEITDATVANQLQTVALPELDLLIRTGGEQRISNFLLWQLAYAELYFTPTLWPDFRAADFLVALEAFGKCERRFGLEQVSMTTGSP
ncbi:MAG: polyprenyl diphosphate synthase [Pseudomonadota bacterium]|nr:polyprenyl diphosphate synthase [Pseudomonadota bacterium]